MKVCVTVLQEPKIINISGKESWLDGVYAGFRHRQDRTLSGQLTVFPEQFGYSKVEGSLSFVPDVPCSRCDKSIPWAIEKKFSVTYKPTSHQDFESEIDLSADELDSYYLDESDQVDLEQLLIDLVFTELPTQLVKKNEDGSCTVCKKDLKTDSVYKTDPEQSTNPFAALKGLNFPDS